MALGGQRERALKTTMRGFAGISASGGWGGEPCGWVCAWTPCSLDTPFPCVQQASAFFVYLLCVYFSQLLSVDTGFMLIVVIPKNVLFENIISRL